MTLTSTTTSARNHVSWTGFAWITWRQHRLMLLGTGVLVAIGTILMGLIAVAAGSWTSLQLPEWMPDTLAPVADMLLTFLLSFSAVIAAFWSAPLLSREYEQHTHLFAWSQDVSPARWLAGKSLVLILTAAGLALLLGFTADLMIQQLQPGGGRVVGGLFNQFRAPYFGAAALVQLGYTLFGFALGLVISAISRRTVLAMGVTLGAFLATRMLITQLWRPYYLTPVRATTPVSEPPAAPVPFDGLYFDSGFLNAAGKPVDYPTACLSGLARRSENFACLREHGIVGRYRVFQPIERLETFQVIEFGIYSALALVLLVITWRILRRPTRGAGVSI